jgi:hypothetical protein
VNGNADSAPCNGAAKKKNREHAVRALLEALQQAKQKATSGGSHTGATPDAVLLVKVLQISKNGDKQRLICSSVFDRG